MKKLALVCALLFVIVYLLVNTLYDNKKGIDVDYPCRALKVTAGETPVYDSVFNDVNGPIEAIPLRKGCYIIVGSFTDLSEAQRQAEKYKTDYGAVILILPPSARGYYRISLGRYDTGEKAEAALLSARNDHFPDAWILKEGE